MEQELALEVVRKQKAKKSHLTVPAATDADIRTLCGVAMKGGEYEVLDEAADCTPCLRKQDNRALISSAYFAQDAGSRLLEMSLTQSTAGRARPKGRGQPAKRRAPAAGARPEAKREKQEDLDAPSQEELAALGLAQLKQVGPLVHESPAGVLVRVQKRSGRWIIAEVTSDGPANMLARSSGRTTFRLADVEIEASPDGPRLKFKPR